VLLQPDWMRHLCLIALTHPDPARSFDQEVRHPWLCFALLWFRARRKKEKVWPNHFLACSQHTQHTAALHPG
jgi:hypothetical protein